MNRRFFCIPVLLFAILGAGPALTRAQTAGDTRTVAMSIDCSSIDSWTKEAQDSVRAAGQCNKTGMNPNNYVCGTCGDNFVFIYDEGAGVALISYGAGDTPYPMVAVSWSIWWINWDTNFSDGDADSQGVYGYSWGVWNYYDVGPGYVTVTLNLEAELSNGWYCTGLIPNDAATLSG